MKRYKHKKTGDVVDVMAGDATGNDPDAVIMIRTYPKVPIDTHPMKTFPVDKFLADYAPTKE